jgi:hypothetical protein
MFTTAQTRATRFQNMGAAGIALPKRAACSSRQSRNTTDGTSPSSQYGNTALGDHVVRSHAHVATAPAGVRHDASGLRRDRLVDDGDVSVVARHGTAHVRGTSTRQATHAARRAARRSRRQMTQETQPEPEARRPQTPTCRVCGSANVTPTGRPGTHHCADCGAQFTADTGNASPARW